MATKEQAQQALADFRRQMTYGDLIPAQLGSRNSSGEWTITRDVLRPSFCDVTFGDSSIGSARNTLATWKPEYAVLLRPDRDGTLYVVGGDGAKADKQRGAGAPGDVGQHWHGIGSGNEYIHPTRLFEPGLVHAYEDGTTLYIRVEPFEHEGGRFAGGILSLASNVPGAGLARVVLVSLDVATNALQATNGPTAAANLFNLLSASDATAITVSDAIRLCGVRLQAGQTSISRDADFFDQRRFLEASSAVTDELGFPILVTTAITIPTNRQLVLHETTIDTGGSITLEGTGFLAYV